MCFIVPKRLTRVLFLVVVRSGFVFAADRNYDFCIPVAEKVGHNFVIIRFLHLISRLKRDFLFTRRMEWVTYRSWALQEELPERVAHCWGGCLTQSGCAGLRGINTQRPFKIHRPCNPKRE